MSQRTYMRRRCSCCSERIPVNGAAYVAHMRKHVRAGEAEEIKLSPYGGYSYRVIQKQAGEPQ